MYKQSTAKKTSDVVVELFVDLESWGGKNKPSMDDISAPSNYKSEEAIAKYKQAKMESAWSDQAKKPALGEIYCIGVAINDEPVEVIVGNDEEETMQMFDIYLQRFSLDYVKAIGHNIIDFDALFFYYKGLQYALHNVLALFSDKNNLIDTMKVMDGPSWKTMMSLDKMSKLLRGKPAKGEVDGSMVHGLVTSGQGEKVIKYAGDDVTILRECYRILQSRGVV